MSQPLYITGHKYGKLKVLFLYGKNKHGHILWFCKCDCGNETIVPLSALRTGHTKSCGCLQKEILIKSSKTHGKTNAPEYRIWEAMIRRCTKTTDIAYKNYGERGIKVCDRWIKSFQNFFDDMGERPSNIHSLDRIENNGNYEPSNCRWATRHQQSANTRRNVWIDYDGLKMIQSDWEKKLGMKPKSIQYMLKKGKKFEEIYKRFSPPLIKYAFGYVN